MKTIIEPVDRKLIKQELTPEKFLRPTNKSQNDIYIITAHDSPHIMREIGRLRELSYRTGGGGSGEEVDTDAYDFMEIPYKQLIVWDPQAEEIVGGYRFMPGSEVQFYENGQPKFVMAHFFHFSDKFVKEYMPYTIELGRAFVQPDYQSTKMGMKSLFALDNLWDGLGALIHSVEGAKYFIGKVTVYPTFSVVARDLIYEYLDKYFKDTEQLIVPYKPIYAFEENKLKAKQILIHNNPADDYKLLIRAVRQEGENIPSLFNAYLTLTDTLKIFGTIQDHDFGSIFDTGMMVIMDDLHENKKQRYVQPYIEYLRKFVEEQKAAKKLRREEKLKRKLNKKK